MNDFFKEEVNLDPEVTKKARSSRDFLYDQLKCLPDKTENFPKLYSGKEIYNYGSFSRRTKIRPLDDIDFMLILTADGSEYGLYDDTYKVSVPESASNLRKLLDDNGFLSSRRISNKIKKSLSEISQYEKADIRSSQEAVILKLISYEWTFDIIPAFITKEDDFGRSYYLIPDGNGHWKKTDPRIDQERVTKENNKTDFNVLKFIRVIKYWNKIQSLNISSYLIECIILDYFETEITSDEIKTQLLYFFKYLKTAIWNPVYDPKGIQGNLNNLDYTERSTVEAKAKTCISAIEEALELEDEYCFEKADEKWRIVFGDKYV